MRATLVCVLALCLAAAFVAVPPSGVHAQTAATYTAVTIAGSETQDREGVYGVNSVLTPSALCTGYSPTMGDSTIMVGAANYMFTLNRFSTQLSFYLGNPNATGSSVDWTTTTSSAFGTTRLTSTIYACATTARTSANSAIYYVTNDQYLYKANPDTQLITATVVAQDLTTEFLWDVAIYAGSIYVLTTNRVVYRCVDSGTITCTNVNIQGDAAFNNIIIPQNPTLGLAVNADGIFIAPRGSLYWFSLTGALIAKTADTNAYIDVGFTRSVNRASGGMASLMAATSTGLYSVAYTGTTITATALATPTFPSAIFHIYPLTMDSVFVTLPLENLVQWTTFANTTVASTIDRTPFPVGFVDQSETLPLLLSYMDYELVEVASTVPYPSIAIDTATPAVDATTWTTGFDVDVSNNYYDTALGVAIQSAPTTGGYARSLRALESYYNRTNFILMGDYNLLPMCNLTKMTNIRRSLASDVRALLMYPFIYTSAAKHFTVNTQPNLSLIKLLMPAPFGVYLDDTTAAYTANATTPALLSSYDDATAMVTYTRMNYETSHIFDALFPVASYPRFADLSAEQEQVLRWLVYNDALRQLARCAAAAGTAVDSNTGDSTSSGTAANCVQRVGIDNMTQYQILGVSPTPFNFTLFIPEGMYSGFDLHACLNGTIWTDVNKFNSTLVRHRRTCGTGCIVGVAVASAVVAAILVVVIVILTSKRRRLATVIVPVSSNEPKFTSTVDADSNSGSGGNPLAY